MIHQYCMIGFLDCFLNFQMVLVYINPFFYINDQFALIYISVYEAKNICKYVFDSSGKVEARNGKYTTLVTNKHLSYYLIILHQCLHPMSNGIWKNSWMICCSLLRQLVIWFGLLFYIAKVFLLKNCGRSLV